MSAGGDGSPQLDLDAIERRVNSYEYYWAVSADIRALVALVRRLRLLCPTRGMHRGE